MRLSAGAEGMITGGEGGFVNVIRTSLNGSQLVLSSCHARSLSVNVPFPRYSLTCSKV